MKSGSVATPRGASDQSHDEMKKIFSGVVVIVAADDTSEITDAQRANNELIVQPNLLS